MSFLVIDIGNTRTKWALAGDDGKLSPMEICLNADIAKLEFPLAQVQKTNVSKAIISNVAGKKMAQQITQCLAPLELCFMQASEKACGVKNGYTSILGIDRWAALVAAWKHSKHAVVVVNAGTAITIDCLGKDGAFIGGTIMPGLYLMRETLRRNAAQIKVDEGEMKDFPTNTQDAVAAGSLNAAAGAIHLMLKRLEKHSGWLPKLIISGGDAHKVAQALNLNAKQVIIIENLVLQGLVLLENEAR
jgi:type III pantothenate kinase